MTTVKNELTVTTVKDELRVTTVKDELRMTTVKDELRMTTVKDELRVITVKDELRLRVMIVKDELRVITVKDELRVMIVKDELRQSTQTTQSVRQEAVSGAHCAWPCSLQDNRGQDRGQLSDGTKTYVYCKTTEVRTGVSCVTVRKPVCTARQ